MAQQLKTRGSARFAALLRGVNLGGAKKVAMSDLRRILEDLGFVDVRTLLNSGNAVFTGPRRATAAVATRIQDAIAKDLGVTTATTVLTAAELGEIVRENPLLERADNPSRLHVAFFRDPVAPKRLAPVMAEDWTPDILAVGARAAYMWLPNGMSASKLPMAVDKVLRDDVTVRTWGTVSKIAALLETT